MKFDPLCKPERLCTTGDSRYSLTNPYLDTDDAAAPRLVATNAHALAVVPVDIDEDDTAGPVPSQAVAEARKKKAGGVANPEPGRIACNGAAVLADGREIPRPDFEGRKFPDWRRVTRALPEHGGPEAEYRITLDPRLLLSAAEAIGAAGAGVRAPRVVLTFYGPDEQFRVDRYEDWRHAENDDDDAPGGVRPAHGRSDDEHPHAVMMPMRVGK